MAGLRKFIRYALMRATVMRALLVASVITPILTIINHYPEIVAHELTVAFWRQVVLTFLVPYCVSTYSSAMANIADDAAAGGEKTLTPGQSALH